MIDKTYTLETMLAIIVVTAFYFAGYYDAKHKYQCDQIGGTSSIYKGEVATYKVCK